MIDRAELEDKLQHAQEELLEAERLRSTYAASLEETNPGRPQGELIAVPAWYRDRLTVELHTADLRVDLYRQVVASLREQLGLR